MDGSEIGNHPQILDELPLLAASGCRSGGVPVGLGPLDDGPGELDQQWIVGHGS